MSQELLLKLVQVVNTETYHPGDTIVKQGDFADRFFVIASGKIDVRQFTVDKGDILLAKRETGEFVGEMALLSDLPRNATLIATTFCVLISLSKAVFSDLLNRDSDFRSNIETVAQKRRILEKHLNT